MRCACCKGDHDTVAQVRACHAHEGTPSSKQMSLAQALAREKKRLDEYLELDEEAYHNLVAELQRGPISVFINKMLKQPNLSATATPAHDLFKQLHNGKYALREEDDSVRFYAVTGNRSRRLYELSGAPGDFRYQHIYRPEKILKRICADPIGALGLFGIEIGKCGRCGSPLTQEHTRTRGIGDICYAREQELRSA